jgi:hypothetical protein
VTQVNFSSSVDSAYIQTDDYVFDEDIIRHETYPKSSRIRHITSSDPEVIFPIAAVDSTLDLYAQCVAYKPGKFCVITQGSSSVREGDDSYINASRYKYVKLDIIIRHMLGRENNTRLALDSIYGRKIAGFGVDCDTSQVEDNLPIANAFKNKNASTEFGITSDRPDNNPVNFGWFRNLTYNTNIGVCSHLKWHAHSGKFITAEETHVIDSLGLIRIDNPIHATITSVTIDGGSITIRAGNINTIVPEENECISHLSVATRVHPAGIIKFNLSRIGDTVNIKYKYVDAYQEIWGGLQDIKEANALSVKAVFLTGGITLAPAWAHVLAEEDGITLCSFQNFSSWEEAKAITYYTKRKFPLKSANMLVIDWSGKTDLYYFHNTTPDETYNIKIPKIIENAKTLSLPVVTYIHDFFASETHPSSIWLDAARCAAWKKETIEATRQAIQDFYEYYIDMLNHELNVYWLTRSAYERRYKYMNQHIQYHVDGDRIYVKNTGNKEVEGITFKFVTDSNPSKVVIKDDVQVPWVYDIENGVVNAWFDLAPGQMVILEIQK